jgi:predicted nucleic acid-binding protein
VNGFLVDTNIPSELTRDQFDGACWPLSGRPARRTSFLSVMTIGKTRKGIDELAIGQKRSDLRDWLDIEVRAWFAGRTYR